MSLARYLSKLAALVGSDGKVPAAGLASGAAVSNIGYTPVNKAGDTITGGITHSAATGNNTHQMETASTTNGHTNRFTFKNASGAADVRTGVVEWYDNATFKGDMRFLKAGGVAVRNSADVETFKIGDGGRVTMPKQPRFFAYEPASGASGITQVFKYTTINNGSHYDANTGIFTVPAGGDGTYMFIWGGLMSASTGTVGRYHLYKNNLLAGNGQNNQLRLDLSATGSEIESGEHSFMVVGQENDQFKIVYSCDDSSTNTSSLDYFYFTGYLMG